MNNDKMDKVLGILLYIFLWIIFLLSIITIGVYSLKIKELERNGVETVYEEDIKKLNWSNLL